MNHVVDAAIPLAIPNIGPLERALVDEALASGYVSSVGPFVNQFEQDFAQLVGSDYAIACATGTAALHVAMLAGGVRPGTDVLCSDFTFIGSANPIIYAGARPILVDSEPDSWNMDPLLVAEELRDRARRGVPQPAAVEVVHVLGQPANLEPIADICAEFGVPIIEDAAESLGAGWAEGTLAGRHTGTVGQFGCFSFNGNKIVTTGGGGMIVTNSPELAARAKHLTTQAKVPDAGYLHDEVGFNYRLTNMAAGLGIAQLRRLDEFVEAKRRIADRYDRAFESLPVTAPPRLAWSDSTYWLYSMLTEDAAQRDALLAWLNRHGVMARTLWRPLRDQPPLKACDVLGSGRVGRHLFERGVSLPCSTQLTEQEQDRTIDAVLGYFAV